MGESMLFDPSSSDMEKYHACKAWLRDLAFANLPLLRSLRFEASALADTVTLIAYVFYPDENAFAEVEFSILHTWRVLGQMPITLVVDRETRTLVSFRERYQNYVKIIVSGMLKPGSVDSMGADCVVNLFRYFDTPYCLLIQNDGFPLRPGLSEFIGKYDYIGAPSVLDTWRQGIADLLLRDCLNGGFSLRSKRCCEMAAQVQQKLSLRYPLDKLRLEDHYYCHDLRRNLYRRLKLRFPWAWEARRFSVIDFYGALDVRSLKSIPFGVHGPTTVFQYRDYLCEKFHYKVAK